MRTADDYVLMALASAVCFFIAFLRNLHLLENEEKIYLTDKNGYYKISDLEEGGNYLVTVLSGKEVYNLSPKSRTYKNLSKNMTDQNFYAIEKIIVTKRKDTK